MSVVLRGINNKPSCNQHVKWIDRLVRLNRERGSRMLGSVSQRECENSFPKFITQMVVVVKRRKGEKAGKNSVYNV